MDELLIIIIALIVLLVILLFAYYQFKSIKSEDIGAGAADVVVGFVEQVVDHVILIKTVEDLDLVRVNLDVIVERAYRKRKIGLAHILIQVNVKTGHGRVMEPVNFIHRFVVFFSFLSVSAGEIIA